MQANFHRLEQIDWQEHGSFLNRLKDYGITHGFVDRSGTLPASALTTAQVHGTEVLRIDAKTDLLSTATRSADGLAKNEGAHILAVKTADCLSILFAQPNGSFRMVLHAGWRGLCSGIITSGLKAAAACGVQAQSIVVGIGPAIGSCHFEVGPEVLQEFAQDLAQLREKLEFCVRKGRNDRWHLDLQTSAAWSLIHQGVPPAQIAVLRECTYCTDRWWSYRREGKAQPCNWSWIQ